MASPESSEDSGGTMNRGAGGPGGGLVREQDRFLPIANVSRIMKKALPGNAKISKEAKETVQECVSEFISFVTGEASDKCQREKRKTINGDDLLWAMSTLGFEDYVEPLKLYLHKFREVEGERANVNNVNNAARQGDPLPLNHPSLAHGDAVASSSASSASTSLVPHHYSNGAPLPNGHALSSGVPLHPQGNMQLYHHPPSPQMVMQYHVQSSPPGIAPPDPAQPRRAS